jgi:hypothetical protein
MLRNVSLAVVMMLCLSFCLAGPAQAAEGASPMPDFHRVYDLIRQNLPEMTEAELQQAAVEGMVSKLSPKVSLLRDSDAPETGVAPLTRSNLFDSCILYLRIARVRPALDQALRSAWEQFSTSNKLTGVVLDLRYASGEDQAAAVAAAGLFIQQKQKLLDWGEGMVEGTDARNIVNCPVVALVNHETTGAAESLAAVLRQAGKALILGKTTAGKVGVMKDFPLEDGYRLRLITRPILLGDGSAIPAGGVVPDIVVDVTAADEKVYYADPFAVRTPPRVASSRSLAQALTNQPGRRARYGEAELVRDKRQGLPLEAPAERQQTVPETPQLQDVTLLRAIDLLKGLSVIRQTRS